MSKNKQLREKLESNSLVKVGGAFDAMSAKLVENAGFDAIWAGSFAISATHALPDASILTMTEFFNVASSMEDACNIPIIASGGIANLDDIAVLLKNAHHGIIGAITGRAIYEGSLDFNDAQTMSDIYDR